MGSLDFYVEYNVEIENVGVDFYEEADRRLGKLTQGKDDIVGASVSLENIVKAESPYLFQVRIVLYKRPKYVSVVEKANDPITALKKALSVIERKVYESREKRSEAGYHKIDEKQITASGLRSDEIYARYVGKSVPLDLLKAGRTEIASKLMVKEGLSQKAAYFAADQIIQAAQELNNHPEEM